LIHAIPARTSTAADKQIIVYMKFLPNWLLVFLCCANESGLAQEPQLRMIIGTGVVCRTEPDRQSPAIRSYRAGDIIGASRESRASDGTIWYFDLLRVTGRSPACWIYGPLTTFINPAAPEQALVVMVDHLLARSENIRFEEAVEIENVLTGKYASTLESSGLLQLRRLNILARVVAAEDASRFAVERDPMKQAWIIAHREFLTYFEPGAQWYVRPESYWVLYDRYPTGEWVEELVRTAALRPIFSDECYSDCQLRKLIDGPLQYWKRFPTGLSIDEVLERAIDYAEAALKISMYEDRNAALLFQQIRTTLANVSSSKKNELLGVLEEAEKKYRQH
jgi:hypothetical protein